jgi:Na+/H+ antiporter NhaD/arsenite permease-like protein
VGASANVVVAGISGRAGYPISFARFMKYGIPITIQGLVLSSVWLWFLFLR